MARAAPTRPLGFLLSDYGMLLILLLLCAFFSASTIEEQHPTGPSASRQLASSIGKGARVLIVVRDLDEDAGFAEELRRSLEGRGIVVVETVRGGPSDARRAIVRLAERSERIDAFACNRVTAGWAVYSPLIERYTSLAGARVY